MNDILLVGEDSLCCELGAKILRTVLPGWTLSGPPINKRGITRLLPALSRYANCARHVRPVLCIADTDHECPVDMKNKWFPEDGPPSLLLRLAVSEAESWVLADRRAVADFFDVPLGSIPGEPECLEDAKLEILRIISKTRRRSLRAEMLGNSKQLRPGAGYNVHLSRLIAEKWELERAVEGADSLRRAVAAISALQPRDAIWTT